MITEAHGIPLAVSLTGGNRNDVTQLMPLIEAIPPVRGRRGAAPPPGEGLRRPRLRPRQVPQAGPGCRHHARDRPPQHGTWLGPGRAPMGGGTDGRAADWFRRLRVRWEIRDDIHEAFLSLACAIICWRRLRNLALC